MKVLFLKLQLIFQHKTLFLMSHNLIVPNGILMLMSKL